VARNLVLDPELIERALKLGGEKTKKAAVTRALEEFITDRSQKRLADLMGKLEWDRSVDYKAERTRRECRLLIPASGRLRSGATGRPMLAKWVR